MQTIQLNEKQLAVDEGGRLFQVRDTHYPEADLLILNGYPTREDCPLSDGDEVVMIQRGKVPSREELEALMMARHSPGVHRRLSNSRVGIAGAGGLGSNVAVALARVGVGSLVLADFDLVEPSNLNRQQYFVDQIGMTKVEALKQNLNRINPYVQVDIHPVKIDAGNLHDIFAKIDVLVEAFDAPEQKAMLTAAHLARTDSCPLVAASGMAGHASSNSIQTRKIRDNFYLVGDLETAARPGQGLMAPRVGIAAAHQANAVLRLLLGEESV